VFLINNNDCFDCDRLFQDLPDILTVRQMQEALQIGRTKAYRLLNSGAIESFQVGKSTRVLKKCLIYYVNQEQSMVKYKCKEQG
jgi:excisionase family DNA binding protein